MTCEYSSAAWTSARPIFSSLGIENDIPKDKQHNDLISFLAYAKFCRVDLLPIKWQPALESVGEGAMAVVNQSLISIQLSYAFKRVRLGHSDEGNFHTTMTEMLILSKPTIRENANIIRLEACCLELLPDGRLMPVLIFEKAPLGDLEHFITREESRTIALQDWLDAYIELGEALQSMHDLDIVHSDFKPANVLVFRGSGSKVLLKIADFGFSSIAEDQQASIRLGKTSLWAAPELEDRSFGVKEAQKTDLYSFGLTFYWLLINRLLLQSEDQQKREQLLDFHTLQNLKREKRLLSFSDDVLATDVDLRASTKGCFSSFLAATLSECPEDRVAGLSLLRDARKTFSDFEGNTSRRFSSSDGTGSRSIGHVSDVPGDGAQSLLVHPNFQLRDHMLCLALFDYRVRKGIVDALVLLNKTSLCQLCKQSTAFQLALITYTSFGLPQPNTKTYFWFKESGAEIDILGKELKSMRDTEEADLMHERLQNMHHDLLFAVDIVHEYRDLPSDMFEDLKKALALEIQGCERVFGRTHTLVVSLKRGLSALLSARGDYVEATAIQQELVELLAGDFLRFKVMADLSLTLSLRGMHKEVEALRHQVVEGFAERIGHDHTGTLTAMANLAHVKNQLGHLKEAETLLLQVIDAQKRKLGSSHFSTLASMSVLVGVWHRQKRFDEAEKLQQYIVDTRKKILGSNHEHTWTSILNLAAIISAQGERLDKAEQLEMEVIDLRRRHLGPEHPLTLFAMSNLAATYRTQQRWKEQESLLHQIFRGREKKLGPSHGETILTARALANNCLQQGRPKEALTWCEYVNTNAGDKQELGFLTTIAWTLFDQGFQNKAEEQLQSAVSRYGQEMGETDEEVLNLKRHLAMMYKCAGRLDEARDLHLRVCESRRRILGSNHKDTLTSQRQVAEIETMIRQQNHTL